jgi:PhnB protein
MVKAIPEGYHSITPYIIVDDAKKALEFYTKVLGGKETVRMAGEGGRIMHAEVKLGNSMIMLADENPQWQAKSPKAFGGSPVTLMFYCDNVDELVNKAVTGGATLRAPVSNQFYGDRMGTVIDPFGHTWHIATHVEDVSPEELKKRMASAKPSGQ